MDWTGSLTFLCLHRPDSSIPRHPAPPASNESPACRPSDIPISTRAPTRRARPGSPVTPWSPEALKPQVSRIPRPLIPPPSHGPFGDLPFVLSPVGLSNSLQSAHPPLLSPLLPPFACLTRPVLTPSGLRTSITEKATDLSKVSQPAIWSGQVESETSCSAVHNAVP